VRCEESHQIQRRDSLRPAILLSAASSLVRSATFFAPGEHEIPEAWPGHEVELLGQLFQLIARGDGDPLAQVAPGDLPSRACQARQSALSCAAVPWQRGLWEPPHQQQQQEQELPVAAVDPLRAAQLSSITRPHDVPGTGA